MKSVSKKRAGRLAKEADDLASSINGGNEGVKDQDEECDSVDTKFLQGLLDKKDKQTFEENKINSSGQPEVEIMIKK